jgi:hypothetical protein
VSRPKIAGFIDPRSFEWRELRDPDGPATWRQLRRLNREGRLELVPAGTAVPISKAEAAFALDAAGDASAGIDGAA